jgi:glutathione S-transferase
MTAEYSRAHPDGQQVHAMLEGWGLPFRTIALVIGAGSRFQKDFLALGPQGRMPALEGGDKGPGVAPPHP